MAGETRQPSADQVATAVALDDSVPDSSIDALAAAGGPVFIPSGRNSEFDDPEADDQDQHLRAPSFRGPAQRKRFRTINAWLAFVSWVQLFVFIGIANQAAHWNGVTSDELYFDTARRLFIGKITNPAFSGVALLTVTLAHSWWCFRKSSWNNEFTRNGQVAAIKGEVGFWSGHLTLQNSGFWVFFIAVAFFTNLVPAVMCNVRDLGSLVLVMFAAMVAAICYRDSSPKGLHPRATDSVDFDPLKAYGERQAGNCLVALVGRAVYLFVTISSLSAGGHDPQSGSEAATVCIFLLTSCEIWLAVVVASVVRYNPRSTTALWQNYNQYSQAMLFFPFVTASVVAWTSLARAGPSQG